MQSKDGIKKHHNTSICQNKACLVKPANTLSLLLTSLLISGCNENASETATDSLELVNTLAQQAPALPTVNWPEGELSFDVSLQQVSNTCDLSQKGDVHYTKMHINLQQSNVQSLTLDSLSYTSYLSDNQSTISFSHTANQNQGYIHLNALPALDSKTNYLVSGELQQEQYSSTPNTLCQISWQLAGTQTGSTLWPEKEIQAQIVLRTNESSCPEDVGKRYPSKLLISTVNRNVQTLAIDQQILDATINDDSNAMIVKGQITLGNEEFEITNSSLYRDNQSIWGSMQWLKDVDNIGTRCIGSFTVL